MSSAAVLCVQASVDDLKAEFAKVKPKYNESRQRFTTPPTDEAPRGTPLAAGKPLSEFGITDGSTIFFKDLGPQVLRTPHRRQKSNCTPTIVAPLD